MLEIQKPLEPNEATRVIRRIVKHGGEITLSRHCRTRLKERNLTIHDILKVLLNGIVKEPPEYSEKHEQYKYKITGPTIDSGDATAITVIINHRSLLIVTVY